LSFLQELKTRAAITPAIMNSFFINLYVCFILRMFDYFTRRVLLLAILILRWEARRNISEQQEALISRIE
jgi:hypothetical protein